MPINRLLTLLITLILLSPLTYANQKPDEDCLLLGPSPSLIIKFKDGYQLGNSLAQKTLLNDISTDQATFTSLRKMSGGAYILFFTPNQSLYENQIAKRCYSRETINAIIDDIKQKHDVEYIDPNILMRAASVKGPSYTPVIDPKQWDMLSPPGGMDVQTAYATTTGSANAISAVLDTGLLTNASLAPNALAGVSFTNNGSFTTGATPSCDATCAGYDHGTHVAGTVATSGTLAYGEQIYGVAPTSKVLPVNVFSKFTDPVICQGFPPCILAYNADQINGLNWLNGTTFSGLPAAPLVADVNMSLGGAGSCATSVQTAINNLLAKNVTFAIASGNSNVDAINFTPANCSGVLAISATGPDGYGAYYSNYGSIIDFAAPGGDQTGGTADGIYSTIAGGYGYKQGTSMASPHGAGLILLLYTMDPALTPTLVRTILQSTATAFPSGGPMNACTATRPCGTGIINAPAALAVAISNAPTLVWPAAMTTPTVTVTNIFATQVTVNWDAAGWLPARASDPGYKVFNNGTLVPECDGITTNSCIITGLTPNTSYNVYVQASDARFIYSSPIDSPTVNYSTNEVDPVFPPVLTRADRNPLRTDQAIVYYSYAGDPTDGTYTAVGLPAGTYVTRNSQQQYFVIHNISTPKAVSGVAIKLTKGGGSMTSNTIDIPSIL